ncbi:NAD(P)/FAD-dependent oxidoreductase [Paenibacillus macerans]|uniref:bile acid Fe-S flavoenzyme BaiCD n=1 Tax=Paenibacillus macerans TaxID=44252 RepID=UPI001F0E153B|nr:FAD-dependent oxidoreductase [Paenibacillus macerans]UMV45969.1 NAD(P)/FAD-dependent oxidoreductase [Paenibacillus macerans]
MAYSTLFSPIQIRGLTLKNRVILPAMGTKMPTEDRFVSQQLIDYHVARAEGGCGLNFTEVCSVYGPASPKKFLAISDDKYIPGLKQLTESIHEAGGKAGIQLWLGGMAVASDPEQMIIIPSPVPVEGTEYTIPGADIATLKEAAKSFGDGARRAVEAGFDAIEFHAGHNYTPHSFLSPFFNRRTDEYGGELKNRARFLIECIEAIRLNIPAEMPLFMRIDAHDDYLEGGLTIEEVIEFCNMAKAAGVDVLDVSRGNFSSQAIKYEVPPIDLPRGFNVDNAARIRKETGMLTIAVGRINDPAQAEEILASCKSDMVVIGRGQLADPEFCNKAQSGRAEDIVHCVACNQGCYDGFVSSEVPFITCLRNPALGREVEYKLTPTDNPKKVVIAGGGIAGLEAAMILKRRGHHPIVCEATGALGGQFALAGEAPRKEEMKDAALSRGEQVVKERIEVRLGTPVTTTLLEDLQPDEVIVAVGSAPMELKVPGSHLPIVTNSHDVLYGKSAITGKVVVVGGGLVGLEVAEYLHGKASDITVVEMLDKVARDLGELRAICVMENLNSSGVHIVTDAKCVEIKEHSVMIESKGQITEYPCDSVVVAIGSRARNYESIRVFCEERRIPYHVIGDAVRARRALDAVAEANQIARIV